MATVNSANSTDDDTVLHDNLIGSDSDYLILQHTDSIDGDTASSDSDYVLLRHQDVDDSSDGNLGSDSDCQFLPHGGKNDREKDNHDGDKEMIVFESDANTLLDNNNNNSDSISSLQKEDDVDGAKAAYHNLYEGCRRNNCQFLWEFDVRQSMEDEITKLSDFLSVSRHEASLLLLHFDWSVDKVTDHWIVDESLVRKKVGLLDKLAQNVEEFVSCGKCAETCSNLELVSASCGHLYCRSCWSCYISTSINDDGVGCLKLRCPESSCHAAINENVIESSVSLNDKKKLSGWLITSYIKNKKAKWCPNPNCEYAIKFLGGEGMNFDVTCLCLNSFCWNCHEEGHRPLDCETVKKWIGKTNSVLSKNEQYRKKYCKSCPKCKRPVEKLGGHMQIWCCDCNHEFCWFCLKPHCYLEKCNGDMESDQDYKINITGMLPPALIIDAYYFERWYANRESKLKALSDFKQVMSVQFESLSKMQSIPTGSLDFITKAWLQIVECRQVLEWSYAYGHFMPEHEPEKKAFLEHLLGVAESTLEKLHDLMGKELDSFINFAASSEEFREYRQKLVDLTNVTASYFDNLLKVMESGLSEIASNDQASSITNCEDEAENYWFCDRCTFANLGTFTKCSMCVLPFDGYEPLDF